MAIAGRPGRKSLRTQRTTSGEKTAEAEAAIRSTRLGSQKRAMISYPSTIVLNALSQQVISGAHDGLQDFCFGLDLNLNSLEKLQCTG